MRQLMCSEIALIMRQMTNLLLIHSLFFDTYALDSSKFVKTAGATSSSPVVPLVTGCGRSGTHTVGELLNTLGIRAIHEGALHDGVAVSWFYGTEDSFSERDNSISHKIKARTIPFTLVDKRPKLNSGVMFHPVLHIVRNPLKHISATMRCICSKGDRHISEKTFGWDKMSWQYIEYHINIPKNSTNMMKSALYWLYWNRNVAQVSVKTFRIEDLNPRELVKHLDIEHNPKLLTKSDFDVESVPTSLKIRAASYAGNKTQTSLTWKELEDGVGSEITSNIIRWARIYGYDDTFLT